MFAAWLRRYQARPPRDVKVKDKGTKYLVKNGEVLTYDNGQLPEHGDHVWVRCEKRHHERPPFDYLEVSAIEKRDPRESLRSRAGGWRAGRVCVTGANIDRKHHERVFLLDESDPRLEITETHQREWKRLIADYQAIHEEEIKDRKEPPHAYLGKEPGQTAFSSPCV